MKNILDIMSSFYRIVQIVECVVCEESDLGTNAIVGFFFLNIFGLVLVDIGTMGLACALECMRATVVVIGIQELFHIFFLQVLFLND